MKKFVILIGTLSILSGCQTESERTEPILMFSSDSDCEKITIMNSGIATVPGEPFYLELNLEHLSADSSMITLFLPQDVYPANQTWNTTVSNHDPMRLQLISTSGIPEGTETFVGVTISAIGSQSSQTMIIPILFQ